MYFHKTTRSYFDGATAQFGVYYAHSCANCRLRAQVLTFPLLIDCRLGAAVTFLLTLYCSLVRSFLQSFTPSRAVWRARS